MHIILSILYSLPCSSKPSCRMLEEPLSSVSAFPSFSVCTKRNDSVLTLCYSSSSSPSLSFSFFLFTVQSLSKLGISVENIVVNQILFPDKDVEDFEEWYATKDKEELGAIGCDIVNKMIARKKMQEKYIDQIFQLYEDDFHIVLMPILDQEIRGVEQISSFSELYFTDPEELGEEKEG